MTFQKFDAGALSRTPAAKNRDCQVRALVSALDVSYESAWKLLYQVQRELGACDFQLVRSLRDKDARFNVVRSRCDAGWERGHGRWMTVAATPRSSATPGT